MVPPQSQAKLLGRRRPHHPQLEDCHDGGRHRQEREQRVSASFPSPAPDQPLSQRQRETRGRDHGPDDGDPTHGGMKEEGRGVVISDQ